MLRKAFALGQPWLVGVVVIVTLVVLVTFATGSPTPTSAESAASLRDDLHAVFLLNTNIAWAVGSFGAIFHTQDGGKEWHKHDSQQIEPLYGVSFVTKHTGWICGKSGVILHTPKGTTWGQQVSGTTGMITGSNGLMLTIRDGIVDFGTQFQQ